MSGKQRFFTRHPVQLTVKVRTPGGWQEMTTSDVSRRGIFVRTDEPIPAHRIAQMKIQMPSGHVIDAMGHVRRVVAGDEGATGGGGMGVEFFVMSKEAEDEWDAFVLETGRAHRQRPDMATFQPDSAPDLAQDLVMEMPAPPDVLTHRRPKAQVELRQAEPAVRVAVRAKEDTRDHTAATSEATDAALDLLSDLTGGRSGSEPSMTGLEPQPAHKVQVDPGAGGYEETSADLVDLAREALAGAAKRRVSRAAPPPPPPLPAENSGLPEPPPLPDDDPIAALLAPLPDRVPERRPPLPPAEDSSTPPDLPPEQPAPRPDRLDSSWGSFDSEDSLTASQPGSPLPAVPPLPPEGVAAPDTRSDGKPATQAAPAAPPERNTGAAPDDAEQRPPDLPPLEEAPPAAAHTPTPASRPKPAIRQTGPNRRLIAGRSTASRPKVPVQVPARKRAEPVKSAPDPTPKPVVAGVSAPTSSSHTPVVAPAKAAAGAPTADGQAARLSTPSTRPSAPDATRAVTPTTSEPQVRSDDNRRDKTTASLFITVRPRDPDHLRQFMDRRLRMANVFLRSSLPCFPGQPIDVAVVHPASDAEVIVSGAIARVIQGESARDNGFLMRFDDLSRERKKALVHFINTGEPPLMAPTAVDESVTAQLAALAAQNPESLPHQLDYGWSLITDDESPVDAIEPFLSALTIDPGDVEVHLGLSLAYALAGDLAKAYAFARSSRQLAETDAGPARGDG